MFTGLSGREKCLSITSFVGFLLIILTLTLALYGFPEIIGSVLEQNIEIKKGTDAWDRFVELPIPLNFKIYIYEITNPDDVINNKKPVLNELGPFIFKQTRRKHNLTVDGKYVSFYQRQYYEFDREATDPKYSIDMPIMTTNAVLLGMYQILEKTDVKIPFAIDDVIPQIFDNENIVYEEKFDNLMFNGVEICKRDRLKLDGKFVCLLVTLLNFKMVEVTDDLRISYSFFAFKNDKDDGLYKMDTGIEDIEQVGSIVEWNNVTYTNTWGDMPSECDKVEGYDKTVFPPYIKEGSSLKVYTTDICRSVSLDYYSRGNDRGVDTYKFRMAKSILFPKEGEIPEDSCFCVKQTKGIDGEPSCFLDGLLDIQSCLGIPAVVSLPHFLDAEKYLDGVDGVSTPDFEKHGTEMDIQPFTGIPVKGSQRVQINMIMRPAVIFGEMVEKTKNLYRTVLPIAWIEEGVVLEGEFWDLLNSVLYLLNVVEIVQWVLVGIAVVLCVVPATIFMIQRKGKKFEHV